MLKILRVVLAALAAAVPACNQVSETAQTTVNITAQNVKAGNISMIEVLRIPDAAMFVVNVTPNRLESWWQYKFATKRIVPKTIEITDALSHASVRELSSNTSSLEIRWGIVFYSKTSETTRLSSFYFDRTGRTGAVNDKSVSFGPNFLSDLKKALGLSIP